MPRIRWTVKNPLNQDVFLKASTFEKHIAADHEETDANFRTQLERQVKLTVADPDYITVDRKRFSYHRLVTVPYSEGFVKLKTMKVIVEADEPREVVTWIAQSKNKDVVSTEAIIYERGVPDK